MRLMAWIWFLCACQGGVPQAGSNGLPTGGETVRSEALCDQSEAGLDLKARPVTIPALREWRPAAGVFRLGVAPRLVYSASDAAMLAPVAEVFAADLRALTGGRVSTAISQQTNPGDIRLVLGDCDARLGAEGYRLRIGEALTLSAPQAAGVFYASRSVLQLLAQGRSLAAGEALDWPRYPERGLMVDIGRKHFTPDWIHRQIREMAYLKLNLLHLHFSENLGFRIASERFPELAAQQHLTRAQVAEIVALAARHFITVVPEIGMPGHMGAALANHPEFQLVDLFGQAAPNQLDVSLTPARDYAHALIEEFLPLFPGPYWHTGADEYIAAYDYPRYPQLQQYAQSRYGEQANGKDAVHGYINEVTQLLASKGKTTRAWHDDLDGGSAVSIDNRIVVEWWTDFSPLGDLVLVPGPQELLDRGHRILNAGWFPTYYVVGGAAGIAPGVPAVPQMRDAYENWQVHEFYGPLYSPDLGGQVLYRPPQVVAADEPNNLGAKLQVWCDGPDAETEDEIAENIAPRLRVIAQKTWNSALLTPDYGEFQAMTQAIGHAPDAAGR